MTVLLFDHFGLIQQQCAWPSVPGPAARGPAARAIALGPAARGLRSGPAQLGQPSGTAQPRARTSPPRPGRNLGVGREFGLAPLSRLGCGAGPIISVRPSRSNGGARSSGHQKPRPAAPPSTQASFSFTYSLSSPHCSPLLSSVKHQASGNGEAARSRRRRRPPRRRARSPAGERTVVERPGRGAPMAGSRRAVSPSAGLSFPTHRHDCSATQTLR